MKKNNLIFEGLKFKVYDSTIEDDKWCWENSHFGWYKEQNGTGFFFSICYLWWRYK